MATNTKPKTAQTAGDEQVPQWVFKGGAAGKLAWVQAHVEHVDKTGRNTHQKFDYMQEHGILACVRPYQRLLRFAVVTKVVDVERDGNSTTGTVVISLRDVEQPPVLEGGVVNPLYEVTAEYPMEATDNQGWGSAKLLTYAEKFAQQKFFKIPTEDLPEAEAEAVTSTAQGKAAGRKITAAQREQLTKALVDARPGDELGAKRFNDRVKAKLVSDFGVDKVAELKQSQLEDFQAWVLEDSQKAA